MAIDSMRVAIAFREMRTASQDTKAHQLHLPYDVQRVQTLDPSLTNQFVYGNRSDWVATAAQVGFVDVDLPIAEGARRFLTPDRLVAIINRGKKKKTGMSLY